MDLKYAQLAGRATELLGKYGKPVTVIVRKIDTGDPWLPDTHEFRYETRFVQGDNKFTNRPETVIQQGDIFGYMALQNDLPVVDMTTELEIKGERYQLVQVEPLEPGNVNLLYIFQARA